MRAVGRLVLKGKTQALQVFTPNATLDLGLCAPAPDYQAALAMLQAGTAQGDNAPMHGARAAFEALATLYPQDPLVTLHLQRLRQGSADDLIVMQDK
jgi:adenylate cyclase